MTKTYETTVSVNGRERIVRAFCVDDVRLRGDNIEVRLVCEGYLRNFWKSIGTVHRVDGVWAWSLDEGSEGRAPTRANALTDASVRWEHEREAGEAYGEPTGEAQEPETPEHTPDAPGAEGSEEEPAGGPMDDVRTASAFDNWLQEVEAGRTSLLDAFRAGARWHKRTDGKTTLPQGKR